MKARARRSFTTVRATRSPSTKSSGSRSDLGRDGKRRETSSSGKIEPNSVLQILTRGGFHLIEAVPNVGNCRALYPKVAPTMPNIRRSEEMILVGYFLARCASGKDRKKPPEVLNARSWGDAYPMFYNRLGDGRSLDKFCSSLRLTRDSFDAYVDNGRKGWWQKPLGQLEQDVFDRWQSRGCAELWAEVRSYRLPAQDMPNRSNEPNSRPGIKPRSPFVTATHRVRGWLTGR